jgi:hypothetical protein
MYETISIKQLSFGSVYKLLVIGLTYFFFPFGLVVGVFALIGWDTVKVNGAPLHGWSGFGVGLFAPPLLALFFSFIMGTATALGLRIYSWFRPLQIRYLSLIDKDHATDSLGPN